MKLLSKHIIFGVALIYFGCNSIVAQKQDYAKKIEGIAAKDKVKRAFQLIDAIESQTEADLIFLTEIPAPPFLESERAMAFKKLLEQAGLRNVWIDDVGNVIGLLKGTHREKVVVLDAHLDTVFPEGTNVKVQRKGDTLVAPGIGDDTRGLAMLIAIAKAIRKSGIQTRSDVLFVGSVGEEGLGDLRGVKHLFKENKLKITSWISIDGGAIGRINNAGLGSVRYKAVFKGKGGHSWGAFGLANPHHALGEAISRFTVEAASYTSNGPKTSFNIGRIGGGTSVNSIPFESWMEVDMRSVSKERLIDIDSIFKSSTRSAVDNYNNSGVKDVIHLELIKIGDRPSGSTTVNAPLVLNAMEVTKFFNVTPRLTIGSTNSNIPISLGIPAITIGRGGEGGGAHSLDEWWVNKDGAKAIKLAMLLTLAQAEID